MNIAAKILLGVLSWIAGLMILYPAKCAYDEMQRTDAALRAPIRGELHERN